MPAHRGNGTADVNIPANAVGGVLFAHGSGSSRFSTRNRAVASVLQKHHLGTVLLDLLTVEEEQADQYTREHRFNIQLLAGRLLIARKFVGERYRDSINKWGLFGASTGAAAALMAASKSYRQLAGVCDDEDYAAVVSRGGRVDLAGQYLRDVRVPVLLLVGSLDSGVVELNEQAKQQMEASANVRLKIIPGATHLFEEPGKLELVAEETAEFLYNQFITI